MSIVDLTMCISPTMNFVSIFSNYSYFSFSFLSQLVDLTITSVASELVFLGGTAIFSITIKNKTSRELKVYTFTI